MAKYEVTVVMVFPDDLHAEDIKNVAEQRLGREVKKIAKIRDIEG